MKKILVIMMAILMSLSASSFASTTTLQSENKTSQKVTIPVKIIIKQVITFSDKTYIELYYQKDGTTCKLYSKTDISKYKANDLNRVKSTSFEIVDYVEGTCRMTKKASDVIALAKSVLKQLG